MVKILDILQAFLKEVEKENPFKLVLKGGTALSLYHLNHHRESEDLDFDADVHLIKKYKSVEKYFAKILGGLKQRQMINSYKITKAGFASTNRYHIKLELKTHKIFYTKIDVNFVKLPKNLIKKNQLCLYLLERMFIAKAVTFVNRKEFKDLYDLTHLIDKIDPSLFRKKENVADLIQEAIETTQQEDVKRLYKIAFRNVDLRFRDLKESQLDLFIKNAVRKLRILTNKLRK